LTNLRPIPTKKTEKNPIFKTFFEQNMVSDPVSGHFLVVDFDCIAPKMSPRFTDNAHIKIFEVGQT